jgi:hypothetical protein
MTHRLLKSIRPGLDSAVIHNGLQHYAKCGVLLAIDAPMVRGRPIIYALNNKHVLYRNTKQLCMDLWDFHVQRTLSYTPESHYWAPGGAHRSEADFDELYSGFSHHGEILHLLAEIDTPVEQVAVRELLKRGDGAFFMKVSRLVAFGLLKEKYVCGHRFISLDAAHPIAPSLRLWLRKANRLGQLRYRELAELYFERKKGSAYERAFRMRRTMERRGVLD